MCEVYVLFIESVVSAAAVAGANRCSNASLRRRNRLRCIRSS